MSSLFVGLMSGTSLDGVDAVLLDPDPKPRVLAHAHQAFDAALRLDHVRRLTERLTVVAHRSAHRTTEVDVNLAGLDHAFREQGGTVWLVGLNPGVLEMVRKAGLYERLGRERMLFNARAAIARYQAMEATAGGAGQPPAS